MRKGYELSEELNEYLEKQNTYVLKGYELIYLLRNLEQNNNLKQKYDLNSEEDKDMAEMYDDNIECIKDTLLSALERGLENE